MHEQYLGEVVFDNRLMYNREFPANVAGPGHTE